MLWHQCRSCSGTRPQISVVPRHRRDSFRGPPAGFFSLVSGPLARAPLPAGVVCRCRRPVGCAPPGGLGLSVAWAPGQPRPLGVASFAAAGRSAHAKPLSSLRPIQSSVGWAGPISSVKYSLVDAKSTSAAAHWFRLLWAVPTPPSWGLGLPHLAPRSGERFQRRHVDCVPPDGLDRPWSPRLLASDPPPSGVVFRSRRPVGCAPPGGLGLSMA